MSKAWRHRSPDAQRNSPRHRRKAQRWPAVHSAAEFGASSGLYAGSPCPQNQSRTHTELFDIDSSGITNGWPARKSVERGVPLLIDASLAVWLGQFKEPRIMREINLQVLDIMLKKGAAGDFEALREYVDPEFEIIEAESLPYGGRYLGFEGYVEIMRRIFKAWEDLKWEIVNLIADGDSIAVRLILSGRRGVHSFSMPVCEVWEFRAGKLFRHTPYYFDTKKLSDLVAADTDSG
jgi:uncharacterized protein